MIQIDFKKIKIPLLIFIIFICLSLTLPFFLPAQFMGAYLLWIILAIVSILYGISVIGGLK